MPVLTAILAHFQATRIFLSLENLLNLREMGKNCYQRARFLVLR